MGREFEGNDDWIKRENGRIPTKRAMAAERASAGLGTSDDDADLRRELAPQLTVWAKPPQRSPRPDKQ